MTITAYEWIGGPNIGTDGANVIFGSTFVLAEPLLPPQQILDNYSQSTVVGVEGFATAIQGLGGNDTLVGDMYDPLGFNTEGDVILGGNGNDLIFGDTGTVRYSYTFAGVTYDIGKDPLFNSRAQGGRDELDGGAGNDRIYGGGGSDSLVGDTGNDRLDGGFGDDLLTGGEGRDVMTGGQGRDDFIYARVSDSQAGAYDTILDFRRGQDKINLADVDAASGSGNQSFAWIGTQAFHQQKGELRYRDLGARVIVEGDVNGDGRADFQIAVHASILSASDFFL